MKDEILKKYARLAVKTGVNVQKNQTLVIMSPIECAYFTRMVSEIAYEEGAKDVVIHWNDELFTKIRFMKAPDEVFDEVPNWIVDSYLHYSKQGACFLSISASDPELMKEVDAKRIGRAQKSRQKALKEHTERLMSNKNCWSIVSIPTSAWATKVFPEASRDEAVEKLWHSIFKIVRVDKEDPVAAWDEHKKNLKKSMDFLNGNKLKSLHYKNSKGTDLNIKLPDHHLWLGGAEYSADGTEFIANMPTEEVFTLPKKTGVDGIVYSSKPLNYGGNLIDNFSITFKDGKVIDYTAEKGYDTLKNIIETDEGSHYLGEVALVPFDSPISNSGVVFYNTLYDENASCHLALGRAYTLCLEGGDKMTEKELEDAGANNSLAHVDFMIGTEDLNIMGITHDNKEIPIFINGNWSF